VGAKGSIDVEITTEFDRLNAKVTRSVRYLDGYGLDCLIPSDLGNDEWWQLNQSVVADTMDLPDGIHKITSQNIGGHHIWRPVTKGN
jgi:hypothetical protein